MNRPTSYKLHIAPMFTDSQRQCMLARFDLLSYADVKQHAGAIYSRVLDKSMPEDETNPWPDEWISLFQRWINEGCQP